MVPCCHLNETKNQPSLSRAIPLPVGRLHSKREVYIISRNLCHNQSGLVFTSQCCVVKPLFDLGPVHEHSEGVSEEELTGTRFETPPIILCDRNTILESTKKHISVRQLQGYAGYTFSFIIITCKKNKQKKTTVPPALCHCQGSEPLWDWFARVLFKAMRAPL